MAKPRIAKELVPNPNVMVFHCTTRISRVHISSFTKPLEKYNQTELNKVGQIGADVVKKILAIQGVTELFINPYEISVSKAKLFDWVKIKPRIIKALRPAFGKNADKVQVS